MDWTEFDEVVFGGSRMSYMTDSALEFFAESAEYRVVDRSALEKSEIEQTGCVDVSLPESADNYTDEELIEKVRNALQDGQRDIQRYQFQDGNDAPRVIEIWRHGSGYTAFVLDE